MDNKKDQKTIKEELKNSADKLFGEKPKDIQEELEKETYLGTTKNLAEPTDIDEDEK